MTQTKIDITGRVMLCTTACRVTCNRISTLYSFEYHLIEVFKDGGIHVDYPYMDNHRLFYASSTENYGSIPRLWTAGLTMADLVYRPWEPGQPQFFDIGKPNE